MKEITLKIPETKFQFFLELFGQLGLEVVDVEDIPQWQKDEVLKRMQRSKDNPERLLEWDIVKNQLKFTCI